VKSTKTALRPLAVTAVLAAAAAGSAASVGCGEPVSCLAMLECVASTEEADRRNAGDPCRPYRFCGASGSGNDGSAGQAGASGGPQSDAGGEPDTPETGAEPDGATDGDIP
jgi:hypothetical protein